MRGHEKDESENIEATFLNSPNKAQEDDLVSGDLPKSLLSFKDIFRENTQTDHQLENDNAPISDLLEVDSSVINFG